MFSIILPNFPEAAVPSASVSSSCDTTRIAHEFVSLNPPSSLSIPSTNPHLLKAKKKRSLPGNPDPDAEVIALSPKTLLATNRFVCEICNKGFQRDQNLQLHRRGHNLPWKLKQRSSNEVRKRAYVCPEPSCVHHHPSRALGDLTGIKKHFCRKHGEKKWKCEKCSKIYAVQSDWKAHSKTCGTREYRCDCGTLFSRKDSFVSHRAFCDALAEESARLSATNKNLILQDTSSTAPFNHDHHQPASTNAHHAQTHTATLHSIFSQQHQNPNPQISLSSPYLHHETLTTPRTHLQCVKPEVMTHHHQSPPYFNYSPPAAAAHLSATALLQKAATVGATTASSLGQTMLGYNLITGFDAGLSCTWPKTAHLTRDFLGLTADDDDDNVAQCSGIRKKQLTYTIGAVGSSDSGSASFERDPSVFEVERQGFGLTEFHHWRHC